MIDYAKTHKTLPAKPQDEQFATKAPSLDVNTNGPPGPIQNPQKRAIGAQSSFPARNRIHLDVFEFTGTL